MNDTKQTEAAAPEGRLDALVGREQACQATPHAELIAQILDSRVPKNEREHAACREIERLQAGLNAAATSLETLALLSGKDEFLDDFMNVRGYAANRAAEARKALPPNKD